jgi:glycosyltransferase involved in cell wall biosynthesis
VKLLDRKALGGRKVEFVDHPNPMLERGVKEDCLATFWTQATPGTTYWRCLVPARHLPGQAIPFKYSDLQEDKAGKPYLPRHRGTAVWQFLGDEFRTRIALGNRDMYGYRTLMEVDDNYLRIAPYLRGRKGVPWHETHAEAMAHGNGYSHEMHRKIVPLMDGIICSTDYLADAYYEFNENVYVCPNSIDPDDWKYEREPHDAFRIVYYGSTSHVVDAPLVTDALKWAARQPGVEVWTVGFKNPSWSFPHQVVPWTQSLEEARAHLFKFDLGVAPLKGNKWANGKSDIKAMEYAMAGVCPLVSNAVPYRTLQHIPDLVIDDDGWMEAIRYFVKNPDLARQRAEEVKDWVMRERTIQATVGLWKEAISG